MQVVDDAIRDILDALREREALDATALDRIIRAHSKRAHDGRRAFAKKRILPYYLAQRDSRSAAWESWQVDAELERRFLATMQMKPRRTASGVATITVITKPWPCANDCIYCPNDPRMPKSYLSDEPACQRAERLAFHPYLQVASRLRTLQQMGHATGKVELIVLGGTWMDYPPSYRLWFVHELFCALNDSDECRQRALREFLDGAGAHVAPPGSPSTSPSLPLSPASSATPSPSAPCSPPRQERAVSMEDLACAHTANEQAEHRVVGLVVETRPDTVNSATLLHLRGIGCTKVQLGIQSIDDGILAANGRRETAHVIADALKAARLFGFKTHTHFMLNLFGATPESDKRDYARFMHDPAFSPDEVKLYPCALVAGTELMNRHAAGSWRPYSEEELLDVLVADMLATPQHTRVSRMIRDISAKDIVAGNKKTNLRQLVDERLRKSGAVVREIRYREIATGKVDMTRLELVDDEYETDGTREHFLQWCDPEGRIAGFLRLSLPHRRAIEQLPGAPVRANEAMIREVHVYGMATEIDEEGHSAQHHGLGRRLIERACDIARSAGYDRMNVISAVGTRAYYRKNGFRDNGLYQQRAL